MEVLRHEDILSRETKIGKELKARAWGAWETIGLAKKFVRVFCVTRDPNELFGQPNTNNVQLTLEQHGFEQRMSTYTDFFSIVNTTVLYDL